MILGCCVVTLASHDSLTLFANSLVFIGFHLLLSGSQRDRLLKILAQNILPGGIMIGMERRHFQKCHNG